MGDIDVSGKGETKQFPDNSVAFVRVESGENPFTLKNPYGEFQHELFDASYDHSPYASFNAPGSSMPSGGSAPVISFEPSSIHPFKIKQWTDPATELVYTDVYYGILRYTINSFNTVLENDTNSIQSYHSTNNDGSVVTGDGTSHTHSAGDYSIPDHTHSVADIEIPEHEHEAGTNLDADAGSTSGTTGTEAAHTHGDGSLIIPDHQHENDTTGTLSGTDHTHSSGGYTVPISGTPSVDGTSGLTNSTDSLDITGDTGNIKNKLSNDDVTGTTAAGSSHSHSYAKDDHTHEVSGRTGGVHDKENHDNLTGETAGVYGGDSTPPITGDSGNPTSHAHPAPLLLSTSPSTVDRFVTIKNQIGAIGIMKDVGPTSGPGDTEFNFINNDDGDQTVQRVLTLPAGTFGSIFLKWKVLLPSDQNVIPNLTISASDVEIHVDPDAGKTAESLSDDDTFQMLQLRDNEPEGDLDGIDDTFSREAEAGAGENTADKTAYFYVKLGVSYNPVNGGLKTVDQITYENIYWSPFILGRAYDE